MSDPVNPGNPGASEEPKRMSQEELRIRYGEVLRLHQENQQAIAYAFSGKSQYEKKAQQMADDAFHAALQPLMIEFYDGLISIAVDENGRTSFVGEQ